ncbi:MAG: hypothetical protein P1U86_21550 [Verrucomicrobiales bacterium]|nr:hypothetical protein [Verrucomicrobiales bacterium]
MSDTPHHPKLAALDRVWEKEREQYLIRGRYGNLKAPRKLRGCVIMLGVPFFLSIIALFLFVPWERSYLERGFYILIASAVAVILAVFSRLEFTKAKELAKAEAAYLKRRELLAKRLRSGQIS